jgi:arylsulfatase
LRRAIVQPALSPETMAVKQDPIYLPDRVRTGILKNAAKPRGGETRRKPFGGQSMFRSLRLVLVSIALLLATAQQLTAQPGLQPRASDRSGFGPRGPALRAPDRPDLPNILLITAEDLGFSDLACYGSEILTPNVDQLAKEGLRFTQFYNAGRGCPSQAALLTGLFPHQVGMGHASEDFHKPGYRGNLNQRGATLGELLGQAGYETLICGQWEMTWHNGPEGPKHTWPMQRGFEQFFGTLAEGCGYFDPITLTRDNQFMNVQGQFYLTDAVAQRASEYLEAAGHATRPFFLYVAFTAPHWPLQAKPADLARYQGRYGIGWDSVREARYRRMIDYGILRPAWQLSPRDSRVPAWIDAPNRAWHARRMEVYAAQVDALDQAVGRILEKLKQIGRADNTLVMFLSLSGASGEELAATWQAPYHIPDKTHAGGAVQVGNSPIFLPGTEDTFQSYGVPWANVSNTPLRLYKRTTYEGGIASPLVVRWPAVIRTGKRISAQVAHVIDIVPTCLEAAGQKYTGDYHGYKILPLEGESLLPVFRQETTILRNPLFWEHEGNRAVREGKWKLVARAQGKWELYDLEADRTELTDLAATEAARVANLAQFYDAWAKRAGVLPWGRK